MQPRSQGLVAVDPAAQRRAVGVAQPRRIELDAEMPRQRDRGTEVERLAPARGMRRAGADMRPHPLGRHEGEIRPLDGDAGNGVDIVARPEALGARRDAGIDPPAAAGARLDLDRRKGGAQPVDQRIGAKRLGTIGGAALAVAGQRQVAIMVPFEIIDRQRRHQRRQRAEQMVAHLAARQIEHQLVAAGQ
ncbi:hypothetical protein IP88_15450 [alpha proteobacterium AAP81b]|nr:hypothetical protein IP88_15450 [alpha proteobacterium AAP81b]